MASQRHYALSAQEGRTAHIHTLHVNIIIPNAKSDFCSRFALQGALPVLQSKLGGVVSSERWTAE
jgi:hypothetical protein